jgi:hypothetical protein
VKQGEIGAITREVQQLYFDATRGHLETYRKWLVPIYQPQQEPEAHAVSLVEMHTI